MEGFSLFLSIFQNWNKIHFMAKEKEDDIPSFCGPQKIHVGVKVRWISHLSLGYVKRQGFSWDLKGCGRVIWIVWQSWDGRDKEAKTAGCA